MIDRLIKQARLRSFCLRPKYKYGFEVPRDYRHAMQLDQRNGNTKWKRAVDTEYELVVIEYEAFIDKGKFSIEKIPDGYKLIKVHMVFDVKPDGRHRGRLVADGHLTDIPLESVYSGVVSLKGLRACIFLGELNGMEAWGTDISSAYLCAKTSEKVCIRAGPEFGPLAGHLLIIDKALYGLKSSGLRWWERISEILIDMGFVPSKAEDDIWMRDQGDHYEYIARYVDDLAIVSRKPQAIINDFQGKYKLKLKGSGPLSYHLGCNFHRDENGTLCMSSTRYIDRLTDNYTRMFGSKPRQNYTSPLEKGDHPELDDSPEL